MNVASLALLLAQLLPTIATDAVQVAGVLDASSTAVKNAQAAPDGLVSAADFAAIDAKIEHDLGQLAADAGITPPAA